MERSLSGSIGKALTWGKHKHGSMGKNGRRPWHAHPARATVTLRSEFQIQKAVFL